MAGSCSSSTCQATLAAACSLPCLSSTFRKTTDEPGDDEFKDCRHGKGINMARKKQTSPAEKAKLIADQAAALAEYAAKALVAAEQLRIKTKAIEHFPLDDDERATVAELPALAAKLKKKLA